MDMLSPSVPGAEVEVRQRAVYLWTRSAIHPKRTLGNQVKRDLWPALTI